MIKLYPDEDIHDYESMNLGLPSDRALFVVRSKSMGNLHVASIISYAFSTSPPIVDLLLKS
jgi:hypothetical protein